MKVKATLAALALAAVGFVMPMAAEAYTISCGNNSISMDREVSSPRYYANAISIMIHSDNTTSYMMPSGDYLSIEGRWYRNGNDIVTVNPDGTTFTFRGAFPVSCTYHY